jgi:hypothetical protein
MMIEVIKWLGEMFAEVRIATGYLELREGHLIGWEADPRNPGFRYLIAVVWGVNKKFFASTVAPRLRGAVTLFDNFGRVGIIFKTAKYAINADPKYFWDLSAKIDGSLADKFVIKGNLPGAGGNWGGIAL